jgi:dCMP deaminase
MKKMTMMRPDKDDYYLNIAEQVAMRSTCLRRCYGAVIVNDDQIIATGYGGAPRKTPNCCEIGFCYRTAIGARKGENYEFCRAVHAEQNAIIQASRQDMKDATLYLVGLDTLTKELLSDTEPCRICKRIIVNAGIKFVIARQGKQKTKKFSVNEWLKNNLWELKNHKGHLAPSEPPRTLSETIDEEKATKLKSLFSLTDAIVVQISNYENAKHAIGRVAARYFASKVKNGNSVGLSCGDTILSLLEYLPYRPHLRLSINQLSIEGDPSMIHQAPATLVGLLRAKCSPQSSVMGLQLPPLNLVNSSSLLRQELLSNGIIEDLRKKALSSKFVFIGVGSAGSDSESFWAMAQAATRGEFEGFVNRLEIIGEINNQVFDKNGNDCTSLIPEFDKHVVNILTLQDIRNMARKPNIHKVVIVATGPSKTNAMRIALKTGLANVLITGREDADRLLNK